MILDQHGNDYVLPENADLRTINLNQYLKFLTDAPTSNIIHPESALSLSTVYSCIRILSDAIAMTPFYLYRQTPGSPEIERVYDGPWAALAKQSSALFNNFTFWQSMIASLNGWGNAYAVIIRNPTGAALPNQLIYMTPNMVDILDTEDPRYRWLQGEEPYVYQVTTGMETFFVRPADMIHLALFTYDGIRGLSPVALNQVALQIENEQTQYGRSFYKRGGKITGVIESPLKNPREKAKEFVRWFNTFYGGQNSGQVAFLPGGLQFKSVSVVNPQDAQWVEARKFSRNEIASIFRVPSYLLGDLDRATWGNVAQLSEEFVRYSLQPIYTLIETELNRKLLENSRTLYYQFDPTILLRGTTTERFTNYSIAVTNGFMSRSEVREKEGLPYEPQLDGFTIMPGAASVGQQNPEDERSLAIPDEVRRDVEELMKWRQQATSFIQMNQNSSIQLGMAFSNKLDDLALAHNQQLEDQRLLIDKRDVDLHSRIDMVNSELSILSEQEQASREAAATALAETLEDLHGTDMELGEILQSVVEEIRETFRIQKMRGTKHQDAIKGIRSEFSSLQKIIVSLDKEIKELRDKLEPNGEGSHGN